MRNTQLNYKYHYNIFILTDQTQFVGSCYNKDGSYLSKDEFASVVDMKNSDWYKDLKELKYGVRWTTPKKDTIDLSQKSYVSLSRVIVDPVTFKFMGVLIVSISLDNLSEIIQSEYVDDGRTTYLFDENGLALFLDAQDFDNNRAHMLYNITVQPSFHQSTIEEIEHQSILVASDTNLKNGWKVVYEVPLDYIFLEIYDTRKKHLLTIGCLVLFFTASLLLMIHKIMKPMRNFKSAMEKISDGDFDIQVKVDSFDEFSSLAQTLNMMAVKVKDLVCQIEEKRKKEQQLKFAVLHAQINPHFLFNSLNTIKLSAELSQAYNISKMITELGKLLKYSINIQMDTTSIQAEVEYLESYIYLYNIRYSNGIKLITEVDECLFDKKIPKMILQPLVENAIIHGFNNSGFGTIKVCINSIQQQIVITVSDDGKGIPQLTIMALQQMR
ncbi:MAG: histidine kinase, partial [Christensenellaceae bacterium]